MARPHCTTLSNIYTRYAEVSCQGSLYIRLCLNSCSYIETAVSWTVVGPKPPCLSLLHFLCLVSLSPMPHTFRFTWFGIISACVLLNLVTLSSTWPILRGRCNSWTGLPLSTFPIAYSTLFCRQLARYSLPIQSRHGKNFCQEFLHYCVSLPRKGCYRAVASQWTI
jgi:hypothetical protein